MKEGGCASVVGARVFEVSALTLPLLNVALSYPIDFAPLPSYSPKTQVKQTKHTACKIYPTSWICKSPLGHCQFKRCAKQPDSARTVVSHQRLCQTFCYHQHHRERHLFDWDKGTAEAKSTDLKYFCGCKASHNGSQFTVN